VSVRAPLPRALRAPSPDVDRDDPELVEESRDGLWPCSLRVIFARRRTSDTAWGTEIRAPSPEIRYRHRS
jgi:hypothetical protein